MLAYIDSSFLIAVLLEEREASSCLKILSQVKRLMSSPLLESECRAVAKREDLSLVDLSSRLKSIDWIFCNMSLSTELSLLFDIGYVRGADAHHLATALWFADGRNDELTFLSLDRDQKKMAKALKFKVI